MTPPMESTSTQTVATIAFGIIASLIGAFTIWQGRRAWRRLYGQQRERPAESNLESQTSEAVELEAHPHTFELPASPHSDTRLASAATSAFPDDERLLGSRVNSASSTIPATTTTAPT